MASITVSRTQQVAPPDLVPYAETVARMPGVYLSSDDIGRLICELEKACVALEWRLDLGTAFRNGAAGCDMMATQSRLYRRTAADDFAAAVAQELTRGGLPTVETLFAARTMIIALSLRWTLDPVRHHVSSRVRR